MACRLGCGWLGRAAEEGAHLRQQCGRFERECRYGCGQAFDVDLLAAPNPPPPDSDNSNDDGGSPPSSPLHPAERHYRDACPLAPVPCPFARFGCEARPARGQLATHHAEAAGAHAGMCARNVERLKEEGREKSRVGGCLWVCVFWAGGGIGVCWPPRFLSQPNGL